VVTGKPDDGWLGGVNVQTRGVITREKMTIIVSLKVGRFILVLKKRRLFPENKMVTKATKSVTSVFKVLLRVEHSTAPKTFACIETVTSERHPLA
jgi:hypothetical protein